MNTQYTYHFTEINSRDKNGFVEANPIDMSFLDCCNGDIVELKGTRRTVAKIISSDDCCEGTIQINSIMKQNTGLTTDSRVNISKTSYNNALSITLEPTDDTKSLLKTNSSKKNFLSKLSGKFKKKYYKTQGEDIRKYLHFDDGMPAVKDDIVSISLSGRFLTFKVLETVPDTNVIITPSTDISIIGDTIFHLQDNIISYDDIGGLSKEISTVREMVELPLLYPKLFEQVGIEPPKGLLLYGPPGCGKTLIARAVAQESGVHFINVNGPEIIQQHYGESEERLRSIFEEAQENAPAIIFFDEIDAVAPNRDTVLGDVEKRVVAQLLTLMDGLKNRGSIVVIAATNLPNNVDPALRRPGRFDREIEINPPDAAGRLEILKIHTRRMPLDRDINLKNIAAVTHGFLGADIAALCREAAMVCIREIMPKFDFSNKEFSEQEIESVTVGLSHFETALNEFELSTTRQVSTEITEAKWEDIGGLETIKSTLRDSVELPLKYSEQFKSAKIRPPKGILLTGPSGTGKTLLARALATESNINFITAKGPELLSKWVGESERGIREIFKKARQSAPSMIFFDEIDAILPSRGNSDSGSNINEHIVGQFILEMDNLDESQGVLVLAATNRPDLIDKALLRPGRFDLIIKLPIPDYEARLSILNIYCKMRNLSHDINLNELAKKTDGMTGADIAGLCHRAAMLSIKESISKHQEKQFSDFIIERSHFEAVLSSIDKDIYNPPDQI